MKHGFEISHFATPDYHPIMDFHLQFMQEVSQMITKHQLQYYVKFAHKRRIHQSGFSFDKSRLSTYWWGLNMGESVDVSHSLDMEYLPVGKLRIGYCSDLRIENSPQWLGKVDGVIFASEATRSAVFGSMEQPPPSLVLYWPPLPVASTSGGLMFESAKTDVLFVQDAWNLEEVESALVAFEKFGKLDHQLSLIGTFNGSNDRLDKIVAELNLSGRVALLSEVMTHERFSLIKQAKHVVIHSQSDRAASWALAALQQSASTAIMSQQGAAYEIAAICGLSALEEGNWELALQSVSKQGAQKQALAFNWQRYVEQVLQFCGQLRSQSG